MKCLVPSLLVLLLEIISLSNGELTIEGSLEWNGNGFKEDAVQVKIIFIILYLKLLFFMLFCWVFSPREGQIIKKVKKKYITQIVY